MNHGRHGQSYLLCRLSVTSRGENVRFLKLVPRCRIVRRCVSSSSLNNSCYNVKIVIFIWTGFKMGQMWGEKYRCVEGFVLIATYWVKNPVVATSW